MINTTFIASELTEGDNFSHTRVSFGNVTPEALRVRS